MSEPATQPSNEERLKAALWHSIGERVDAVAIEQSVNASPAFIGGLMEMAAAKIYAVATDLEAFAKHAGRSTISTKDVVLLARHNDGLRDVLQDKADSVRQRDTSTVD